MKQKTVSDQIVLQGRGLHSGQDVAVRITPAEPGSGYVFFREDLAPGMPIPASWRFVQDTGHNVTLGRESVSIQTVEHLLSALAATGIDNCNIHVHGPEIPLCDGGARIFLEAINQTGLIEQDAGREYCRIAMPVWVENGDRYLLALPSNDLRISCSIHFKHKSIRYQACHIRMDTATFADEIAPARTFGFTGDIEALRRQGLAQGGDYESVLVYDEAGPVSPDLHFEDECVRHKVLDIMGDLALLGRPLRAHIIGHKTGHALDVEFVQRLAREMIPVPDTDVLERNREFVNFCERMNL